MKRFLSILTAALLLLSLSVPALAEGEFRSSDENLDLQKAYYNSDYAYLNDADSVYRSLTWEEAVYLFQQEGNYLILLGGSWCGNTQAVIKLINDYAAANHVTVYNFDTKLDGGYARKFWGYEKDLHIRDNSSEVVGLYVDLVSEYFPNIETEYAIDSENNIFTVNAEGETVTVNKLQVPYFLAYTRGLEDDIGHFVPITAYHEQMLTLDADAEDYVYSEENYAAYTAGTYAVIQSYADQLGIEAFDLTD